MQILPQLEVYSLIILEQISKIIFLLVAVAYFTIAERKVMAAIQRRKGPNVVGVWGILQPLADGAKLLFKELLVPTKADSYIFLVSPLFILILSIISWSFIPSGLNLAVLPIKDLVFSSFSEYVWCSYIESKPRITHFLINKGMAWSHADIYYGLLVILAISGFNVYGIILAGWASNSKYAFLGALRSAAQMISYEVSLGLIILPVILLAGSLNFTDIVIAQDQMGWFIFPLFPCVILFFISMLAETNRAPFDLPEAEAELVAGYNVEYSSIIFAMFFLGEYTNMLLMSTIIVLLFFGGWLPFFSFFLLCPLIWFSFKIICFCFCYILVRAGLPRYRYDQLMDLGWKWFLPISLGYLILIISILGIFDSFPQVLEIGFLNYKETFLF